MSLEKFEMLAFPRFVVFANLKFCFSFELIHRKETIRKGQRQGKSNGKGKEMKKERAREREKGKETYNLRQGKGK